MLLVEKVCKSYGTRTILRDVDFGLAAERSLAIVGPSGAGKTTLLAILGLLDVPTSGRVLIDGEPATFGRADHRRRRDDIGFVFQEFNLVPHLTVRANLELALADRHVQRALHLLAELGLAGVGAANPTRLSAGEQQRVAVVRALAKQPRLVLADEPTASLDPVSRELVLAGLSSAQRAGACVVVVTHDEEVARWADRILRLDARTGELTAGSAA